MERLVVPKTYMIGVTAPDMSQIERYLTDTDQRGFLDDIQVARRDGVHPSLILVSYYAKLCYASLTASKNENVSKTRSVRDNVLACLDAGHGSVFEHVWLNFVTTDCSRVFTHELVRHRVGTAFSQTSGRYVRTDHVRMVHDPILDCVINEVVATLRLIESDYNNLVEKVGEANGGWDDMDFAKKKKLTSALRRILPNGAPQEMGWSVNLRALRHLIMLRTSRHAEWEIRKVFSDVFEIVVEKFPLLFKGCTMTEVDGALEVTGLKTQPYEDDCRRELGDLVRQISKSDFTDSLDHALGSNVAYMAAVAKLEEP